MKKLTLDDMKRLGGVIRLSSDGSWFHDGIEITHERTIDLFNRSIYADGDHYFLKGDAVPVPVQVDDVAFFVRSIKKSNDGFEAMVSDGSSVKLDLKKLDVGTDFQLYCYLEKQKSWAKFERKVYMELMKHLDQRDGYYGLTVDDVFYPVYSEAAANEAERMRQEKEKKSAVQEVKKSQTAKVTKSKSVPQKKEPVKSKGIQKAAQKSSAKKSTPPKSKTKKSPVKKSKKTSETKPKKAAVKTKKKAKAVVKKKKPIVKKAKPAAKKKKR